MKEDGPGLGDVGVPARFKPSDDFCLSVGPVTRLARELVSSDARDARHRGRPMRGCRCRAAGVRGFCREVYRRRSRVSASECVRVWEKREHRRAQAGREPLNARGIER